MKLDDVDGDGFAIEDRRGRRGSLPGGKGAKIGIPALIVMVVTLLLAQGGGDGGGGDFSDILGQLEGDAPSSQTAPPNTDGSQDAQYEFVGDVGTLLEDYWTGYFESSGESFEPARVVVFDSPTDTGGCGVGTPEAGPFYCPPAQQIFIDFGFYQELERRLGFGGDFAMAYVLAHEYGHHIQNQLGISDEVRRAQDGASEAEANASSVNLELQADCFAGAWARSAYLQDRLEEGDFDEAIDAAEAVGDDSIQGSSANQESFTHGTSAQRKMWFETGFESGDPTACNTFA